VAWYGGGIREKVSRSDGASLGISLHLCWVEDLALGWGPGVPPSSTSEEVLTTTRAVCSPVLLQRPALPAASPGLGPSWWTGPDATRGSRGCGQTQTPLRYRCC
jgi:hypothetical protein